ncbi:MAG: hypothetical protein L6Q92_13845 [Phycisphaerae bacterium]|nr:hypothetical protein [Phycisphaerae bacterium]
MAISVHAPTARRVGVLALILLALALVSMSTYVMLAEDRWAALNEEERRDEPLLDRSRSPQFSFPILARSFDASLNQFVDRFIRVCLEGKYSEFRLLYTRRREPPSARQFVSMFNAVKEIRLASLDKLPELPGIPSPAYRLVAEYELEEFAVKSERRKRFQVAVIKEDGEWRLTPLPRGSASQLDALLASTTQPAPPATQPAAPTAR